jgi:diguanylate cyclase (GGDEF)-like protein
VSIGVAQFPAHGADLQSVLNRADQAMYLAKKTGRNRVVVFDPG